MQPTTLTKDDLSGWHELLERPRPDTTAAVAAMFFFACAVIPFSGNRQVAVPFVLVCFLFSYWIFRSFSSLLWLGLTVSILYSLTGGMTVPAVFLSLIFGGAAGALLLTSCRNFRKDWLFLLLPVAAYGLASLLKTDPFAGLLTLLPIPCAVLAFLLMRRCVPHTESLICIAALLAVTLAVAGVVTLAVMHRLDRNPVVILAEYLHDGVLYVLRESRNLYAEAGLSFSISDTEIENTAAMMVNLIPGLYLAVCSVCAFYLYRTFLRLMLACRLLPKLPRRMTAFTVSAFAAILFIVSYLLALLVNQDGATYAGVVCQNLSLVLEPGLALVGFTQLFAKGGVRSCLSVLISIGLLFVLWMNPGTGFALAAFFGALNVLTARFFPSSEK